MTASRWRRGLLRPPAASAQLSLLQCMSTIVRESKENNFLWRVVRLVYAYYINALGNRCIFRNRGCIRDEAYLHGVHRDLSSLEVCGLLKSTRSACRPMACAYGTSAHECSNMRMACSNMRMSCSNMHMTCSNMYMTCSNMNMVTLGVYMHDSARIPISIVAMHHHPPTTR